MADTIDISDSVAYHVYRMTRLLRRDFLRMASDHGFDLTPEQWFCLNKLRVRGPQSQTELTDVIFGDRPNITRIVTKLENKELIVRQRSPEDGRRHIVQLTPLGEQTHDRFAQVIQDKRGLLFEDLTPQDLQTTLRVFGQLEQRLREENTPSKS